MCTDSNMAAAGGNNWHPWDVVRLYNPDFSIDDKLVADLGSKTLSQAFFATFNQHGASLSDKVTVVGQRDEYDGTTYLLKDGAFEFVVRNLPWMKPSLRAYLNEGHFGLADMPAGIQISVTMRRSLRIGANEGRILEDVGIVPDILYRMTARDILEHNQDLFARAGSELAKMASKQHK